MDNYAKIKNMGFEEMIDWLDDIGKDEAPWNTQFDHRYCRKCEPIKIKPEGYKLMLDVAWCELHGNCKYFPEYDDTPSNKEVIHWWLNEQAAAHDIT